MIHPIIILMHSLWWKKIVYGGGKKYNNNHGRFFHIRITSSNETTQHTYFLKIHNVKLWQITCIVNLCNMSLSIDGLLILFQTNSNYFAVFASGQWATNPPVTTVGWHSYLGNIISPHFLCLG